MDQANAKYTHHTLQNALISIMAEMVLQEIAAEVASAQYFSILADESKDLSKKEQVSVVIRYLYNGSVYEEFIGLAEAHRLNAGLTHTIVSLVNKFSVLSGNCILLRNCIGQGYDGASVVAGHLSGVSGVFRGGGPRPPPPIIARSVAHPSVAKTL
jgi:hypothetical protein